MYSTCTLNREENENIIEWAINSESEMKMKIEPIDLNIRNILEPISEDVEVRKTLKIIPSKETEGFFIAKLKKMKQ